MQKLISSKLSFRRHVKDDIRFNRNYAASGHVSVYTWFNFFLMLSGKLSLTFTVKTKSRWLKICILNLIFAKHGQKTSNRHKKANQHLGGLLTAIILMVSGSVKWKSDNYADIKNLLKVTT